MRILYSKRFIDRGIEKITISYQIGNLVKGFCMPFDEFVRRFG